MIKKFESFNKESGQIELHYYAFDFDDNLLHMPTVIHMDKKSTNGWTPIDVSTSEFAIVRNDKDNYRLRNDNPDLAFCEFRDTGPRGSDAFLEDTKVAISRNKYAPSWDSFIQCLCEGAIFSIVTARGHEPSSIRSAVEYIIDNSLTEDEKFTMYSNCLKEAYLFSDSNIDSYSKIIRGNLSEMPLISVYLNNCDYYGVSSESFAKEFGQGSATNPEHAKQQALDKFIRKCNVFGKKVGAKSVSIGFSDDDPKNVNHVQKFFKEKSALDYDHVFKLNVYNTNDPNLKGGSRSRYKKGDVFESKSWGMEGSVIPFSKWNNEFNRGYPNDEESVDDSEHLYIRNATKMATDLYKKSTKKKKPKVE